jgi:hypothetical protein
MYVFEALDPAVPAEAALLRDAPPPAVVDIKLADMRAAAAATLLDHASQLATTKRKAAASGGPQDALFWPGAQVYVGGPGSGAPIHYHSDAVNTLLYGRKRWYLLPPDDAVFSTVPAAVFTAALLRRNDGGNATATASATSGVSASGAGAADSCVDEGDDMMADGDAPRAPAPLECTQEAGDVLYVPRSWGHGVLNLETSVGYAREFSAPASIAI